MPAITAAANPVDVVTSPSTAGTGKSASGTDSSEQRPFATVLAEQAGKAPKAEGNGTKQEVSPPPSPDKPGKAETGDQASATTPADASAAAPLFIPAAPLLAEGTGEEDALDTQIQAAAELMQAVLPLAGINIPAPTTPAPADPLVPQTGAPVLVAATAAASGIPVETGAGDKPLTGSVADMRLALARSKPDEAVPGAGIAPAKLAAPPEPPALQSGNGTVQGAEFAIPKPDAAMAALNASFAGAVPMHAATAVQTNHGGEYRIVTPLGSQHWETAIGNSLVVMTGSGQERAELVLTPPQLGRVEVSIAMKGDEASAVFVSASPAVREALENALPRLREVLADAGITLGQAQVGSESPGQTARDAQNGDNHGSSIAGAADGETMQRELAGRDGAVQRRLSLALVDTYA
jgi:flagellar hook-length control protein FliK